MTRVAIVDDHGLFRAGVRAELEGHVELVGEASSVEDAVALVCAQRPDVVLLDVHMPDGGGVAVIQGAARAAPDTLFLALSASDAAEDVIAVIRAGARGYVTKNIATDELLDAIDRVRGGDAVFSQRLAGFVLDAFAGPAPAGGSNADPELDQLTTRERGSCATSRAAICTRRSPCASASRPRRSRPTCRRCCASCSSRTATSSRAWRPSGGCTE